MHQECLTDCDLARKAFHAINDKEYNCSLAESQVDGKLFDSVKKEYEVAEAAFVQGAKWAQKVLTDVACDFTRRALEHWNENHPHKGFYFDVDGSVKNLTKEINDYFLYGNYIQLDTEQEK